MKICIINNLFPPDGGGAERVVLRQIEEEKKHGNEVVLITTSNADSFSDTLKNVRVYQLRPYNLFHYRQLSQHGVLVKLLWHGVDMLNIGSARRIKQILKKEQPEVVHTHNLMGIGFLVPRVIQSLKITHIHTIHDIQLVEPSGVLLWNHSSDSFLQKIYSRIMKWLLKSVDVVVSPSRFLQEFYTKRGFFRGSEFILNQKTKHIKHTSIVGVKPVKCLFVGSLSRHKGIEILMRAWDLIDKDVDAEVHVVGSGALESVVREWAKNDARIFVHGQLGRVDLQKVYEECQVLIFPSICLENRPTVLEEAMEKGLFIVASDTGGVREVVEGYDGAVLVEPGNVHNLVSEIKMLIDRASDQTD